MSNVKQELEAIRLKNGGLLTEEAILAEAKSKRHPLHSRFTWDDTEAAEQWRLEEARALIRSVYITIEPRRNSPIMVRAYASLPSDQKGEGGYRAIQDVLANKKQRTELLSAALSELEAFKKRYSNLSELVPVFAALETVKAKETVKATAKSRKALKAQAAHV